MFIKIDEYNIITAAKIHSESWKESHKDFCDKEFIEKHTVIRQQEFLHQEIESGKNLYMLVHNKPIGIVSIYNNIIENLYVLPDEQRKGYGSQILQFAMQHCTSSPILWVLDNNYKAYSLYFKYGFRKTGKEKRLSKNISEVEMKYVE